MSELIFEQSVPGRRGCSLPKLTPAEAACHLRMPEKYMAAEPPDLPEVGELDVVRHFTNLSRRNFSVDTHFYPLGSCTMKYNPRICEKIAALDGFANLHPLLPQLRGGGMLTQGALEVLYETERLLAEVCGMEAFSLQPMAGAHCELAGIMLIAAYHRERGNRRTKVIVPDTSHGTNPASAALAGYGVVTVPSNAQGGMDLEAFKAALDDETAAVMMTCPNTLGLFERDILEIARLAHARDALLYYDGANLNAILGRCKPGAMGFDVCHVNLHKTFATPHGGGGPGSGPVGVVEKLRPFLPISRVVKATDGTFRLDYDAPRSIGYIAPFYGNFGILVRAYAYLRLLGRDGLRATSDLAVLNANYVQERLRPHYEAVTQGRCLHECVFSGRRLAAGGVHTLDIARASSTAASTRRRSTSR